MKMLFLLVFSCFLSPSFSQDIPNEDLQKVYKAAENGKLYQRLADSLHKQALVLSDRIAVLSWQISLHQRIDSANEEIIAGFEREVANLEGQKRELVSSIDSLIEKHASEIKREKRKRFWLTLGGIVSTFAAGIGGFLLTK